MDEDEGESEWRSPRGGSVHCDDDLQGAGGLVGAPMAAPL